MGLIKDLQTILYPSNWHPPSKLGSPCGRPGKHAPLPHWKREFQVQSDAIRVSALLGKPPFFVQIAYQNPWGQKNQTLQNWVVSTHWNQNIDQIGSRFPGSGTTWHIFHWERTSKIYQPFRLWLLPIFWINSEFSSHNPTRHSSLIFWADRREVTTILNSTDRWRVYGTEDVKCQWSPSRRAVISRTRPTMCCGAHTPGTHNRLPPAKKTS